MKHMAKIQIIFYSMYGHVYRMAEAIADGTKMVEGTGVTIYQVPELVPQNILEKIGAAKAREVFAHIPVASVEQLSEADAIIFGTPTRFGNMCAQMRNFLDQTGGSPYGASTIAGSDGSRWPSENELAIARFQGKHVAEITKKLAG